MKHLNWKVGSRAVVLVLLLVSLFFLFERCDIIPHPGFNLVSGNIADAQSALPILLSDGKVLFEPDEKQTELMLYNPETNRFQDVLDTSLKISVQSQDVYINNAKVLTPYTRSFLQFVNQHSKKHLSKLPEFSSQQYSLISVNTEKMIATNEVLSEEIRQAFPKDSFKNGSVVKLPEEHLWLLTHILNKDHTKNMFIFDTQKKQLLDIPDFNHPRMDHTSLILSNGKALIIGGRNCTSSTCTVYEMQPTQTVEMFDPKRKIFESLDVLKNSFFDHGSILLANGKVLIFGGEKIQKTPWWEDKAQAIAEIYDPEKKSSKKIDSMYRPRAGSPFAIRLLSGKILITAGTCGLGAGDYTNNVSAELYIPES